MNVSECNQIGGQTHEILYRRPIEVRWEPATHGAGLTFGIPNIFNVNLGYTR
jgi:hypothetical protein